MPLPAVLASLIRRRQFWADYFFGDWFDDTAGGVIFPKGYKYNEYPQLHSCVIEFWYTDYHALLLGLEHIFGRVELRLQTPVLDPPELIAWDDQAYWHPHVLRWDELDLICRCVSVIDPSLPHPGLPLLLLHRFAPVCVGDDPKPRASALRLAWRSLEIFSEEEIARFVKRFDYRDRGLRWLPHGLCGPTAESDYTTRRPGGSFPFEEFELSMDLATLLLQGF